MDLFTELKRRNVFRVGFAYVVLGWVVVQATETVSPALRLPDWTLSFVIWIGVIGFPFALLLAWAFELTPGGLKLERDVDRSESTTHVTGRTLDFLIIAMLVIALVFVAIDQYVLEQDSAIPVEIAETDSDPQPAADKSPQSIAVLPFVNMSEDKDYFADGLTEEILNLLARNADLRVTARTSAFAFKGRNLDLREIGTTLGVNTVLEGSVRRSGKRLRVTAQLINVTDGFHIWSDTYDRQMTDVFELQDDIAGSILAALEIHLGGKDNSRGHPTNNMAAYEKFLQGRALLSGTEAGKARELLREAVDLDPDFAEGWQQLALAMWLTGGGDISTQEGRLGTLEAANRALTLKPDLVLAAAMRASADSNGWTWEREISTLEAALEAHPDDANVLYALSFGLQETGYFTEALALTRRIALIDPLSATSHTALGLALMANHQAEAARAAWQTSFQMGDHSVGRLIFVDQILAGNHEAAIATLETTYTALGYDPSGIRERVSAALNPETRLATVEAWSEEAASLINEAIADWWLYLAFGLLDELIDKLEATLPVGTVWSDSDSVIFRAIVFRNSGLTPHPRYLTVMKLNNTLPLWEQRGPPDFCSKQTGHWVCE
jgi:TolB-like protein/tetratricopeptide (TPR) repeat protein